MSNSLIRTYILEYRAYTLTFMALHTNLPWSFLCNLCLVKRLH